MVLILEPLGRIRLLGCVERRQCSRRRILCGLQPYGRARILSCVERRARLQEDIICGLEPCGRTRRQCCRRIYFVVLSLVAGSDY